MLQKHQHNIAGNIQYSALSLYLVLIHSVYVGVLLLHMLQRS